jgi:hypothetical protein
MKIEVSKDRTERMTLKIKFSVVITEKADDCRRNQGNLHCIAAVRVSKK